VSYQFNPTMLFEINSLKSKYNDLEKEVNDLNNRVSKNIQDNNDLYALYDNFINCQQTLELFSKK